MYDDFAGVYDTLMDDYDYDAWSRHYSELMQIYGKTPARIAECACGTGSLTVRFAQAGLHMVGVDLSASMLRRAEEIALGIAHSFRASAEFTVDGSTPTLLNDEGLFHRAVHALTALLGADRALRSDSLGVEAHRNAGSEDFACVSHAVPSLMIALAAGRPQDGHDHPAHHPMATFDEAALPPGAAAYAALALAALTECCP